MKAMKIKNILLIIVLFMMVGGFSIFPFINQAFTFKPQEQTQLPDTNLVDSALTEAQETALLQKGKTIVRFEYNSTCEKCLVIKDLLEQLAAQEKFKDQIVVEEIPSESKDLPKVGIIGFAIDGNQIRVGQKAFQGNVTQEDILNSLCALMLEPPVECALRNV